MSGAGETIGVDKTIITILGTYCFAGVPLTPSSLFASCRISQLRIYAFVDIEKAFNCVLRKVPCTGATPAKSHPAFVPCR